MASQTRTIHETSVVPKRALLAVAGTALGLVLLLNFRTPDTIPTTAAGGRTVAQAPASPSAVAGGAGAVVRPTPARTAPPATALAAPTAPAASATLAATPGSNRVGAGSTPAPRVPATAAPTQPPPPAATPAPTPAPKSNGTADVTGPAEQTPYGNVQVEVKMQNGRITDIVAVQLPNDRRRSAQISQYVEPILHQEAPQAQSGQIDTISGATWTSGGYAASLQGALDRIAAGG